MIVKIKKYVFLVFVSLVLAGCGATTLTKQAAFPEMYDSTKRPLSILVVPALNESTAADASDYYNVTIAEPLTLAGYYVYPLEIISEILRNEGIADSMMIRNLPASAFKDGFGADAVLFVTITSWDKSYMVIASKISVGLEFVMLSTMTNEVLWSYSTVAVVDASGSSGFFLADLISTAINTAAIQYVTVAKQANAKALVALPFGPYHESFGADGSANVVESKAKDKALEP